jgi:hypothetical protein
MKINLNDEQLSKMKKHSIGTYVFYTKEVNNILYVYNPQTKCLSMGRPTGGILLDELLEVLNA